MWATFNYEDPVVVLVMIVFLLKMQIIAIFNEMIAFVLSNKQSEPHRHTWRDSTLIPLNSLVVWRWSVTTRRHPEPDQSSRRYPLFKVFSPPDCYNKLLDTNQLLLCVSGAVSTLAVYQSNNRMKNKSNPVVVTLILTCRWWAAARSSRLEREQSLLTLNTIL